MLIAQISDLHVRPAGALAYGVSETNLSTEHAVHALLRLDPAPDCVLVTGDLTDCGLDEEYALLSGLLARLPMPVYAVPGNHDITSYWLHERLLDPLGRWRRFIAQEPEPVWSDGEIADFEAGGVIGRPTA